MRPTPKSERPEHRQARSSKILHRDAGEGESVARVDVPMQQAEADGVADEAEVARARRLVLVRGLRPDLPPPSGSAPAEPDPLSCLFILDYPNKSGQV